MTTPLVTGALSDLLFVLGVYAFAALVLLVTLFGVAYRLMLFDAAFGNADSTAHEEKENCPSCGARTTVDPDACDHCGESLSEEAADGPPNYGWADDSSDD